MAEPQDQAIRDLTRMSPALGRPAMPKTESFLSAQRPEIPGYISEQQISPVMQELRGAEEAARTRAGEAEVDIEAAKRAEKGREAQMKGELVQRQARETAVLPERQQLMAKRQEFANAAFAPTRDNAEDLAKLFSLIGVLGVAIGGRGRGAGLQAMTAMNGMLEGYRRGRGDLYKQQLGEFDRSLKAMQQQIATLEKQYAEAVKLKALDREAGELEIQRVLAESDSPVLKAMRARQGDLAALSYIQNMAKDVTTAATLRNNLQTAADQRQARAAEAEANRAFRAEESQRNREFRADQAEVQRQFMAGQNALNRSLRLEMALDRSEKLSPKEKEEVRGTTRLQQEIQLLRETFRPEFANFKADVVGDVAAKFRARFQNDPAMAEWWRRYENVALPERHAMFGATLTGKEQESWRKASIGAGSSTAEILSWMGDKDRVLGEKLNSYSGRAGIATPSIAAPTSTGGAVNIEQERRNANSAIERGAPRETIRARFKERTGQEL